MRRYSSDFKHYAWKTDHVPGLAKGVSKLDKLLTANWNRAGKKVVRRKVHNDLKQIIYGRAKNTDP